MYILTAIDKNFDSIGFSGYSYMYFCEEIGMIPEGTEEYKKEISFLKEKYKDKIDIFRGLELFLHCYFINECHTNKRRFL